MGVTRGGWWVLVVAVAAVRGTGFTVMYRDRQVQCAQFDADPVRCTDDHALCECAYCAHDERCVPLALPVRNATPRQLERGAHCTNASTLRTGVVSCHYAVVNLRATALMMGAAYAVILCVVLCTWNAAMACTLRTWSAMLQRRFGVTTSQVHTAAAAAVRLDQWLDRAHRAQHFTITDEQDALLGADTGVRTSTK